MTRGVTFTHKKKPSGLYRTDGFLSRNVTEKSYAATGGSRINIRIDLFAAFVNCVDKVNKLLAVKVSKCLNIRIPVFVQVFLTKDELE